MMDWAKIIAAFLVSSFILLVLVFLVPLVLFSILDSHSEKPLAFDPNVWKSDTYAAICDVNSLDFDIWSATRDLMVNDLVKKHKLVGMHRKEIIDLLGEPDFSPTGLFPGWDLIYWLGPDYRGTFGGLDWSYLIIKLDPNGVVTAHERTVD